MRASCLSTYPFSVTSSKAHISWRMVYSVPMRILMVILLGTGCGALLSFSNFADTRFFSLDRNSTPPQLRGNVIAHDPIQKTVHIQADPYNIEGAVLFHYDDNTRWEQFAFEKADGIAVGMLPRSTISAPLLLSVGSRINAVQTYQTASDELYAPHVLLILP